MMTPNVLVRLAGSRLGSILLLSGCGFFFYGWYSGHSSWVMAFLAAGVTYRTILAYRTMRAYKAWEAGREALRSEVDGLPPEKKPRRGWLLVSFALLLLVAISVYLPQVKWSYPALETPLIFLWGALCLFLAWKLLALVFRMVRGSARAAGANVKARKVSNAKADDEAPVSWMLGRASSAPGRSQVMRELPGYCTRLLSAPQPSSGGPALGFKVERKGRISA